MFYVCVDFSKKVNSVLIEEDEQGFTYKETFSLRVKNERSPFDTVISSLENAVDAAAFAAANTHSKKQVGRER